MRKHKFPYNHIMILATALNLIDYYTSYFGIFILKRGIELNGFHLFFNQFFSLLLAIVLFEAIVLILYVVVIKFTLPYGFLAFLPFIVIKCYVVYHNVYILVKII